jgi:hypothetical protein
VISDVDNDPANLSWREGRSWPEIVFKEKAKVCESIALCGH